VTTPAIDPGRAAIIIGEIFGLWTQLQHAKAEDIPAITAQLAALYNEYATLTGSTVTPGDIEAAHARNQAQWPGHTQPGGPE
jgi:hypothetical protein